MRIINLLIVIFVLSAFTMGVAIKDLDKERIDIVFDNATSQVENITFLVPNDTQIPNLDGYFKIMESYVHFIGLLFVEGMRGGVNFGYDNPEYFSIEFLTSIMNFLLIAIFASLLIKPLFYVLIFIAMGFLWLKNKFVRRKNERFERVRS